MRSYRAVLFDVDGVLLDTATFFLRVWRAWAKSVALDPAWVVAQTPGRRTHDVLRVVAPHLDPQEQARALDALVVPRLRQVKAFDGAALMLQTLGRAPWAIVTSGSRWFVDGCFRQTRLPLPEVAVYDEDVEHGKPSPDGYLAAATRLGIAPEDCLVVEDSPSGVAAARAAGCTAVGVASTHRPSQLNADMCLATLTEVDRLLWTVLPDRGLVKEIDHV